MGLRESFMGMSALICVQPNWRRSAATIFASGKVSANCTIRRRVFSPKPPPNSLPEPTNLSQPRHLPLPTEARQAGLAGDELLYGGLFGVARLADEPSLRLVHEAAGVEGVPQPVAN